MGFDAGIFECFNTMINPIQDYETLDAMVLSALRRTPDRCAFIYDNDEISCAELLRAADSLSENLASKNLQTGEPVALFVRPGIELVVGMLAILMAGGCVVPIDTTLTDERQIRILKSVKPRIAVTNLLLNEIKPELGKNVVQYQFSRQNLKGTTVFQKSLNFGNGVAFIVFTSGVTNHPKGVEITHHSYVRRMKFITSDIPCSQDAVDLAWTPASFIGFLDEIFYPLLTATTAVIAHEEARSSPKEFADLVKIWKVTQFRITPSLLEAFLHSGISNELQSVKFIFCSGEAVSTNLQKYFFNCFSETRLLGFYGATEAPGAAFHCFEKDQPPLKTTIASLYPFIEAIVVKSDGTEAALMESGEIWLSGQTLSRGYWRNPSATENRFPIRNNKTWFRTGDLGRMLSRNQLEILGRENEVEANINGVLLNLREVALIIQSVSDVQKAFVTTFRASDVHTVQLVCHYISSDNAPALPPENLRRLASQLLPLSAVPGVYLEHDEFPLTPNGKVDVQRLSEILTKHLLTMTQTREAHREESSNVLLTSTETLILEVFRELLRNEKFSLDDDFISQGIDSLMAMTAATRLSEIFKNQWFFEDILSSSNVKELATRVEEVKGNAINNSRRRFHHVAGRSGENLFTVNFERQSIAAFSSKWRIHAATGIWGQERSNFLKTLSALTEEYLASVIQIQSHGTFYLMGFSFGGIVAYEMARKLVEAGKKVGGLALVEPVTPMCIQPSSSYSLSIVRLLLKKFFHLKRNEVRAILALALVRSTSRNYQQLKYQASKGYGYLIHEAESLNTYKGSVDFIYSPNYPKDHISRWQMCVQGKLNLHETEPRNHEEMTDPQSVKGWSEVVEKWRQ